MVYYFRSGGSMLKKHIFLVCCTAILIAVPKELSSQSRVQKSIITSVSEEQLGGIHYDLSKEVRILNFIEDLKQFLQGENQDKFQVKYKFNEQDIENWVRQYLPEDSEYTNEDLKLGFDKIREVTSNGYSKLSELCGFNFKVLEVLSYDVGYADPNKLSHRVKLKVKIVSEEKEMFLLVGLGFINGEFLIFNTEKGAI